MSGQYSAMAERDRRRRLTGRIVGIAVLLVVLAVTALLWPRPAKGGLTVPTVAAAAPTGALQGVLSASRTGDRICYSVVSRTGVAVLRFVPDWSADAMLGLRDPSGLVVAQPGDTLVLLGTPTKIGTVQGCGQEGRIWTVTSIEQRTASD